MAVEARDESTTAPSTSSRHTLRRRATHGGLELVGSGPRVQPAEPEVLGRFPDAKSHAASSELMPSVYQSAATQRSGAITKQGFKAPRAALAQAAHVRTKCFRTAEGVPLQEIDRRVRTSSGRRKIAPVALARHLLRIAYYVLRDGTTHDARRLRGTSKEDFAA